MFLSVPALKVPEINVSSTPSSASVKPWKRAFKHKSSSGDFSQSGDDVLLVKENDFTPVVDGVTKVETLSFKYFNTESSRTYDKVLINPYKGILAGDLKPQFEVKKDVRRNNVQVYGTITVCGGFLERGAVKTWDTVGG